MSKPTFSVIHASRGRPAKAAAAMRMWRDRAVHPESVEYILCADVDDETKYDLIAATRDISFGRPQAFVEHPGTGSARAWDFAARFSTGQWLIQASDDVVAAEKWDEALIARASNHDTPTVIAVGDGFRRDELMCVAICNRSYYRMQGEFICAEFESMFSDDDFTIRALAAQRDGRASVINARDIIMRHEHHYHLPSLVPFDATYARQNRPEAYASGERLFRLRNQSLISAGLKTW